MFTANKTIQVNFGLRPKSPDFCDKLTASGQLIAAVECFALDHPCQDSAYAPPIKAVRADCDSQK